MYIEAIQEAKAGNFDQAATAAERRQGRLLWRATMATPTCWSGKARGLTWKTNIYLMHAEDQLMAADAFETIATEFIEVHKELQELKAKL